LAPAERSEQILAAATRRFHDEGYSTASLDDIAADAGVARGLLHHYFGSKRDLYMAVIERAMLVPSSVRIVPDGLTGDFDEVIAVCVDWWLDLVAGAGGLWPGSGDFVAADVDAVLTRARDDLVDRMLDEVPFPPVDRALLRSGLRCFAAFARVATDEWLRTGELDRAQTAALLRTTLVDLVQRSVPVMQDVERD
jgi:AcrR family transcriptional regulator